MPRTFSSSPATLTAVARHAGVSPSTVSRFLSGTAVVSAEKRRRIEQAIAVLGYRPNALARSLKRGASMTVGVLTPVLDSPLFGEALLGVDETLSASGYVPLMVCGHWHAAEEQKRIELLLAQRVDGLVVLSSSLPEATLAQWSAQLPLVAIGEGGGKPADWRVHVDNRRGALLATRYLILQGHRRIAHLAGPADRASARARLAGYRQALDEAGIGFDARLVKHGQWLAQHGEAATQQWLDEGVGFSALFAANDQMASGARLALFRHGLRVPEDVSLVGFDAIPASASQTPPLTSVDTHMRALGRLAAERLLARLAGMAPSGEAPAPSMLLRESVAPPR
ncbi:MAG: LacI family DNA-binding transcriptional regulator [Paludibacterium sp.]|uniref:LacI family DNA-binding transcriptional regulator n=1 Tax=Paludibacterium sp. TaxID=1917523 RepID=UPI0025FC86EA|nr:LacI family DNA-binding transcriptional regulator [Paludibacterium sp.]MBV8048807.1 LacI family DNA-binding transcriptional regulator [Paludibacterium sp.]MBV8645917.1 LacI family DNA-binding transcriptional regulator [Paludibacterium sp.]